MSDKKKNATARVTTALTLAPIFILLLYYRSWYLGSVLVAAVLICIYEEYKALQTAGYDTASIATWIGSIVYLPLALLFPDKNFITPVFVLVILAQVIIVMSRPEPKFLDIVMSIMPLITVALPGMCLVSFLIIDDVPLQVLLIVGTFTTSMICDIFAYEFGMRLGRTPFYSAISPNKTTEGAVGGLIGGTIGFMLTGYIIHTSFGVVVFPTWQLFMIGLVGSVVSQAGDLFASLLKRHCGIKDFGNLFPGHGGMMDRMDSVLFVAAYFFMVKVLVF